MLQRGRVVDSLEFARSRDAVSGRLDLAGLQRLAGLLADASGSLDYEVRGEFDGAKAFLSVRLDGELPLTCQRCLSPLRLAVNLRKRLMLVAPGAPWPEDDQAGGLEDERCDAIEGSQALDLDRMLEEEILLGLPISPRHESCEPPAAMVSRAPSPFAELSRLKCN